MKNKIIIILLLITFFSFGCVRRPPPSLEPELIEYHKGTDGLVMEFLQNAPPDEVWENSEFSVGIELKNKGAWPIESGSVVISGFVPDYISIEPLEKTIDLQGKSPGYPEGDYSVINFRAKNINIPKGSKEYTDSIIARAYYDYQTDATVDVCINPFIYSYVKTRETVCEIRDISVSGGQGAPVAITSVKEKISPPNEGMSVEFLIEIKNVGPGEVLGKVRLEGAKLANRLISCSPQLLDMKKGEKTIRCKTTIDKEKGAYLAPLSLSLSYTYTSKINKKIRITTLTT